jgi:hypothetical protein
MANASLTQFMPIRTCSVTKIGNCEQLKASQSVKHELSGCVANTGSSRHTKIAKNMRYAWAAMTMWCIFPVALGLNCTLSAWQNLVSDGSLRLRHVINPVNRTLTVEVESSDDSGWLAFGFNNKPKMIGSKAVIGLPRSRTVKKYALNGKSRFLIRPIATTLTDTVLQSGGGKTVLRYTQPLVDENDDVVIQAGKPVRYLWAQGPFDFLSWHGRRHHGVGSTIIANCTA